MDSLQSRLSLERETVVSFVTEVFTFFNFKNDLKLNGDIPSSCTLGTEGRPANRTDPTAHGALVPQILGSHLPTSENPPPIQVKLLILSQCTLAVMKPTCIPDLKQKQQ